MESLCLDIPVDPVIRGECGDWLTFFSLSSHSFIFQRIWILQILKERESFLL
jgi:hypothetical protein